MAGSDVRKRFPGKAIYRGTQVIFGERKHLEEVLQSLRSAKLPRTRKQKEIRTLQNLIRLRTKELNSLNPSWDRKCKRAHDPQTSAQELLRLGLALPREDYLLARALTEHAEAPGELLARLAIHPYSSVRENVARHPRTPAAVLRRLAEDASEPLWFLVACNPSAPPDLRDRLRARMRQVPAE